MKQKALAVMLVLALSAGTASAQFGFGGVVYDPTNYHNALLRYFQLQQQLIQLRNSYAELVAQYNLAIRMAKNIPNMPARYRALFSQWRNTGARDVYGNTGAWTSGVNSGQFPSVAAGYEHATTQLLPYDPTALGSMTPAERERVKSQYASVELADGANTTALATIGVSNPSMPRSNSLTEQTPRRWPPSGPSAGMPRRSRAGFRTSRKTPFPVTPI